MGSEHQSDCCLSSVSSLGQSSAAPSTHHNGPHPSDDEDTDDEEFIFHVSDKACNEFASPSSTTTATTVASLKNLLEMRSPAATLSTSNGTIDGLMLHSSSASRFDSSIPSLSSIKFDSMPSLATMSSRDGCRSSDPNSGIPNNSFDSSNYIWFDDLDEDHIVPATNETDTKKVINGAKSSKSINGSPSGYHCLSKAAAESDEEDNAFSSPTIKSNTRKSCSSLDLVKLNTPPDRNVGTACRWSMSQFSKYDFIPFSPRRHSHNDIIFSSIQSSPVDIFSFPEDAELSASAHPPPPLNCCISAGSGDTPPKPPRRRGASWESPLPIDSVPIIHHDDEQPEES